MYKIIVKRVLDVVFSGIALLCFAWLFALVAIAIRICDGKPIIYTQFRLGLRGKKFKIYKFRTMVTNADRIGPLSTCAGDSRVTKIGNILRKTSLDELPQLWNVFIGDMSIVGNRPDIYKEYSKLSEYEKQRIELRPGISGLATVNGRSLLTSEGKQKYDLMYIKKCSFLTDMKIIAKTVVVVFRMVGINSARKRK